jgi:hypothetical protein
MDYGATICTPRPKCGECVVARWCESRLEFVPPGRVVADARGSYDLPRRRRSKPQALYEGSTRYYRGRIIKSLCALEPGESITIPRLARQVGGQSTSADDVRALCEQLQREGLLELRAGRVALPRLYINECGLG